MSFHFIRPEWFWSYLVLAGLLYFIYQKNKRKSDWHQWIAPHLKGALLSPNTKKQKQSLWPLILLWSITVFALAGPSWTKVKTPLVSRDTGRVVIFDLSMSMRAADVKPNRLTQARYKLNDLLELVNEGQTGLIAYAGDAFTLAPLTEDHATIKNLIPALSPEIMPVPGSHALRAIEKAVKLLHQSGHQSGDLVWFTDGFDAKQAQAILALIPKTFRLFIYAFGTEEGAPVQLANGKLIKDAQDHVVLTKPNFSQLQQVATQNRGQMFRAYASGQEEEVLAKYLMEQKSVEQTEEKEGLIWQDMGVYFSFLLLIPFLYAFRRGHLYALALCVVGIPSLLPKPAQAAMWLNAKQEAVQSYHQQDYEKAAKLAQDPKLKASALYHAGAYKDSAAIWRTLKGAHARYNEGNAFMQQHAFEQAIEQYESALKSQPYFPEAQENLELAKKLAEQQKEEKEQKKKKEEEEKQQQAQNKDESEQDQQQAQNKDESEQDQQQAKNKDESEQDQQQAQNKDESEPDQQQAQVQKDAPSEEDDTHMPAHLQRMMQQVSDDPSLLLRNKMKLEYLKRQKQGQQDKEQNPW